MQYTDKQKNEIEKLKKQATKLGIRIGLVGVFRLAAMCAVVLVVNQLAIQNDVFVMLMAFVSGACAMTLTRNDIKEAHEKIRAEVQNILDNP